MVRRLNIDGDGQGDLGGHGGEQRAVLVYQMESYRHWAREFGRDDLSVADADALLYLPGRDPGQLRVAVGIPALSPGWQQSFRELLAASPALDAGPAWAGFRPLRVRAVIGESTGVTSVYLADPDGSELPAARAGQYLTLRVPGAGPPAPVRDYSLSSAPGAGEYRISVKREPHGIVSGYLNGALAPGTVLDVAAPRGDFVLDPGPGPVLLISAGIGVTPVLSMLHELAAARSTRDVWWIHAAREPREHPFAAEAHALLASWPRAREHVIYSATEGRLGKDKLIALDVPVSATAYVCGPASFMADMREALAATGLPSSRIRTELFGARSSINPGLTGRAQRPPHQPPGPPGTGPLVTFARSGLSVPYASDGRTVLELAEACDVPTRWACRTGVCHTCTTPLLSGEVAYAPDPLEPPPDGEVLICCSRPRGDLVLDM
jgi:ferredoxin-NADP reductase